MPQPSLNFDRPSGSYVVSGGFVTTVALCVAAYVTCLPLVHVPPPVTFSLLLGCVVGSGFVVGCWTPARFRQGLGAALVSVVVSMIFLGSVLSESAAHMPSPWIWVPGYVLTVIVHFLIGQWIGRRFRGARGITLSPSLLLSASAAAGTSLVVVAGGLVTGFDAGFAVPDWPGTFGANMFFYPLSKMTGGTFYEHAHRLIGALIGLTAIALTVHTWIFDRRWWLRWMVTLALLMVCVQGVLGGFWVNKALLAYVIIHGTLAQILLGLFVVLAVAHSRTWRKVNLRHATPPATTDRALAAALVILLIVQLALGVVVRQRDALLMVHIANAVAVVMLAIIVGMRSVSLHGDRHTHLKVWGIILLAVTGLQVLLGFAALLYRLPQEGKEVIRGGQQVGSMADAVATTLHQSVGASLMVIAVLVATLIYRLLRPVALLHADGCR